MTLQGAAAVVLLWRLLRGRKRVPPVTPHIALHDSTVSVLVPTLNEAARLEPCLRGLTRQEAPLTEIIVVDSGSTDGTRELVAMYAQRDTRIRLESDPPLPPGWIGKVWALQHGLGCARGEWILGVDADTEADGGMVAGAVAAARAHRLELVSFAPRFAGQSALERWVQPALLATLVYRSGAPEPQPPVHRLLANGQCFLVRRDVLEQHGGYAPARASFADDVTLARHYARQGVRCGFLDGRLLYRVRAYLSAGEMWREWGRSIDLVDATSSWRQIGDVAFLVLAQALPVPILVASITVPISRALLLVNAVLLALRLLIMLATAPSYEQRGVPYFLSWLADPLAVFRVVVSTVRRPVSWRGRGYKDLRGR